MKLFYDLLEEIRDNPRAFFGETDIFSFDAFMDGWNVSKSFMNDVEDPRENRFLGQFGDHIARKYKCKLTVCFTTVFFMHSIDECEALEKCLDAMIEFRDKHFKEDEEATYSYYHETDD